MSSTSTPASRERSASPGRKPAPPASAFIHLESIKTVAELYQEKVLKAAEGDKVKRPVNESFLERVSLFQGDITKLDVDAIVNAANKSLLGGGGVDGAIHSAAGPKLLAECRQLNGCLTGESKITRGYNLPARHVIHTVGPVYSSADVETKAKQLASCYKTSLELAVDNSLKHVAFPSISTGIYGYPIEDATHIALQVARDFCESEDGEKLDRIIFVVWSNKDKGVYEALIPEYFPPVQAQAAGGEQAAGSSEASAPEGDTTTPATAAAEPSEAAAPKDSEETTAAAAKPAEAAAPKEETAAAAAKPAEAAAPREDATTANTAAAAEATESAEAMKVDS